MISKKNDLEIEKRLHHWRKIIISSFQDSEVYTGEEIKEILKNNEVLL